MKKMRSGFTMIELLGVLAIIGIIATLGYPFIAKAMAKTKAAQLESQLKQIHVGLAKYYKDMGTFPYYLEYLIKKPKKPNEEVQPGKGGWDAFSAATGAGDDPELVDYWGGPYIDGIKTSPDQPHCLQSTLGTPICFGAAIELSNGGGNNNNGNNSQNGNTNTASVSEELFSSNGSQGQVISAPFTGEDTATIKNLSASHGYDSSSDAFFNVLQISGVPKEIAVYLYKNVNGKDPVNKGNLIEAALGSAEGGDPTMRIGMPALKKYSRYNRIIYRYFRLY
jgi:prepilin-type N-terminal cleavage/methylation domain-containing protein